MEISKNPTYDELRSIYARYFTTGYSGFDINTKFALISLVGFVTHKLREKNPDVTYYQVLKKLGGDIPIESLKGLAVVCSDFCTGCKDFPTFGLEPKQIPAKVKEILRGWLPF